MWLLFYQIYWNTCPHVCIYKHTYNFYMHVEGNFREWQILANYNSGESTSFHLSEICILLLVYMKTQWVSVSFKETFPLKEKNSKLMWTTLKTLSQCSQMNSYKGPNNRPATWLAIKRSRHISFSTTNCVWISVTYLTFLNSGSLDSI